MPVPDTRRVPFDHERLHVYQAALDFVVVADATMLIKLARVAFVRCKVGTAPKSLEER